MCGSTDSKVLRVGLLNPSITPSSCDQNQRQAKIWRFKLRVEEDPCKYSDDVFY